MKADRLEGLIAAPHTPFDADGGLYVEAVDQQAEHLVQHGAIGAFICGTTGEGYAQTVAERKAVAERWVSVRGGLRVIVHVGCHAQADAIELARHAAKLGENGGVHGLACMSPSFYKPETPAELIRFLKPIAAVAPQLGFYYYHIPFMNNITLSMTDFMGEAADVIPNLRGLKYTHPDLLELQRLLALDGGRFEVMFGGDPYLLAAWMYGVRCAVGMAYNFVAPQYLSMLGAFDSGDLDKARAISLQMEHLRRVLNGYGGIAASKAVMNMLGLKVGPVRPPLHALNEAEAELLRRELTETGLFPDGVL